MNKVVLAGLALILVRDCNIGGPRFHGPIEGTGRVEPPLLVGYDRLLRVPRGSAARPTGT